MTSSEILAVHEITQDIDIIPKLSYGKPKQPLQDTSDSNKNPGDTRRRKKWFIHKQNSDLKCPFLK